PRRSNQARHGCRHRGRLGVHSRHLAGPSRSATGHAPATPANRRGTNGFGVFLLPTVARPRSAAIRTPPMPQKIVARTLAAVTLIATALLACSAPAASPRAPAAQQASVGSGSPKTLNVVLVGEPRVLSIWQESTTGGVINIHEMLSNGLVALDDKSEPVPRLAASVPHVDDGSWKLNPDGTMQMTFHLRRNAVWHDGTPVTAADVVFGAESQIDPAVDVYPVHQGLAKGLDHAVAADDHTVVMYWSKPYAFADAMSVWDFAPLPAHLMQAVYERDRAEFNRLPYWADESAFIGTGPFRLTRWEPGAQMQFDAFDRYYLGQPKLDRILVDIVQDNTTAQARV